jgi:molybdopterin/thiamine biosynthesis adenylyltransferase
MLCACYGDLGRLKVDIVKKRLEDIYPEIDFVALPFDVMDTRSEEAFTKANVIVSAVDRNDARCFLQKRSMELRKPLLDLGSGGLIQDGKLRFLGSRASLYMPGQACLYCQTLEDDDPSLSLISLVIPNVIAAAAGLALLLSWLTGYGEKGNFVFYDALSHSMNSLLVKKAKGCPNCGRKKHARQ